MTEHIVNVPPASSNGFIGLYQRHWVELWTNNKLYNVWNKCYPWQSSRMKNISSYLTLVLLLCRTTIQGRRFSDSLTSYSILLRTYVSKHRPIAQKSHFYWKTVFQHLVHLLRRNSDDACSCCELYDDTEALRMPTHEARMYEIISEGFQENIRDQKWKFHADKSARCLLYLCKLICWPSFMSFKREGDDSGLLGNLRVSFCVYIKVCVFLPLWSRS